MTELTKGFLVLWTVRSGQMSYENMVRVAKDNNLTKNQILQQAGTAILAQANQLPQAVLSLLG